MSEHLSEGAFEPPSDEKLSKDLFDLDPELLGHTGIEKLEPGQQNPGGPSESGYSGAEALPPTT